MRLYLQKREVIMIVMDLADWIINLFLLGSTIVIWCLGLFMILMLLEVYKKYIKEIMGGDDA